MISFYDDTFCVCVLCVRCTRHLLLYCVRKFDTITIIILYRIGYLPACNVLQSGRQRKCVPWYCYYWYEYIIHRYIYIVYTYLYCLLLYRARIIQSWGIRTMSCLYGAYTSCVSYKRGRDEEVR